jgi:hypothetical protein
MIYLVNCPFKEPEKGAGRRVVKAYHTDKKEKQFFSHILGNSEWSSCKVIYEEGFPNI